MDGDKYGPKTDGEEMEKAGSFTSLPTGMPLPRPAVSPMTLAMKALRVRYSFSTTPLRMVFNSGIPEPVDKKKQRIDLKRVLKRSRSTTGMQLRCE